MIILIIVKRNQILGFGYKKSSNCEGLKGN